jgi:hypothetical protein
MSPQGRKHHFVPRFHLAGFTENGRSGGDIWEFDSKLGRIQSRTAKTCGFERNFYRINDTALDREAAEDRFALVETTAAPILRQIAAARRLPDVGSRHYGILMAYVSLQYFRSPTWRKTAPLSDPFGLAKLEIDESTRHSVETLGSMPMGQEWFYRMNWTLIINDLVDSPFVTSDSPAALVLSDPNDPHKTPEIPTARRETFAVLSPSLAMVGTFEPVAKRTQASLAIVEDVRGAIIANAARYVYSPRRDISYRDTNGNRRTLDDWIANPPPQSTTHVKFEVPD